MTAVLLFKGQIYESCVTLHTHLQLRSSSLPTHLRIEGNNFDVGISIRFFSPACQLHLDVNSAFICFPHHGSLAKDCVK